MHFDSDQNTDKTLIKAEHPHVVISIDERLDLRGEILIPPRRFLSAESRPTEYPINALTPTYAIFLHDYMTETAFCSVPRLVENTL